MRDANATSLRWITAALLCCFAACVKGDLTESSEPTIPPDTTGENPTIQRGSIAVTVAIDPVDVATAATAQVSVSGLTVRLTRDGSADPARVATTPANGTVTFESLLQGRYTLSVVRQLTAAERSRLSPADQEVTLFAGGANVVLGSGQTQTAEVTLLGARRGSLVISEVFNFNGMPVGYGMGDYLEVYNNGDTTAYLDGLLLARSTVGGYHSGTAINPCSDPVGTMMRNDAARFWSTQIWRFPGSGSEYGLPPGKGVVFAMDAINHLTASGNSHYYDLTGAAFEQFMSDADTDNPGSANMIRVRVNGAGIFGRGFPLNDNTTLALIRQSPGPLALDSLVWQRVSPVDGSATFTDYYGIPAGGLLDAFSYGTDPLHLEAFPHLPRPCDPWIAPAFDRAHYVPHMTESTGAIRRKSLGFTEDGREILQRTRNSARDIEAHEGLLRSLRK